MAVKWINHKGIEILYSDYRLQTTDQIIETLHVLAAEVEQAHKKVFKIIDCSGVPVNKKIGLVGNELGKRVFNDKTACSVFIGVTGLRRFYFEIYRASVRYPIHKASSYEEAVMLIEAMALNK